MKTITWWKCPTCGKSGEISGLLSDGIFKTHCQLSYAHREASPDCPAGLPDLDLGIKASEQAPTGGAQ